MEMKQKYYTYKNTVVLNNYGRQCKLINGKIHDNGDCMFTPTTILAPNFNNGLIEILECETSCGQVTNSKYGGLFCSITDLREVTGKEAITILERQVNTISDYLSEKEQNNE